MEIKVQIEKGNKSPNKKVSERNEKKEAIPKTTMWNRGQKNPVYFWHRKLTLKVRFWHFLTTCHSVNSQNKIFSFEDIGFWPKTFLILYPSLENLTTHIIIIYCVCVPRLISHKIYKWWCKIQTLILLAQKNRDKKQSPF